MTTNGLVILYVRWDDIDMRRLNIDLDKDTMIKKDGMWQCGMV